MERANGSRPAGCGVAVDRAFWALCDAWGMVVQAVSALGLVSCVVLMLWALCVSRRHSGPLLLFLLATAAIFSLPYAFLIMLGPQTCVARVFAFGVAFSLAFGALLARALALLGVVPPRGAREVCVAVGLVLPQLIIAIEWLLVVLVQDHRTCRFSQPEFAMLQIYVMVLLAAALVSALLFLQRACGTYSFSTSGTTHRWDRLQGVLLVMTLLLSASVWLVWLTLLTYGNTAMGRSPAWDDPALCIALATNGWVLLLGHGLSQVLFMCRSHARTKDPPLDFTGWTRPRSQPDQNTGADNSGFQMDTDSSRGPAVVSTGILMRDMSAEKDYSIPRPTTTNTSEPYDEYYGPRA